MSIPKLNAVAQGATDDSKLRDLANLKSTILQMQAGMMGEDNMNQNLWSLRERGSPDPRTRRSVGIFSEGTSQADVLVEWKGVYATKLPPGHSRATYEAMIERRIKNLARLLKSKYKPEELRTLDCVGVVSKEGSRDYETEYGMMFRVPSTKFRDLRSLLNCPPENMFLGDWFQIARSMARAVLCLHLAGWLHKGIKSENLLYFTGDDCSIAYDEPYLVGFEYSRELLAYGQTEGVTDDLESNLYRHEEVQGPPQESLVAYHDATDNQATPRARVPFSMKHDIFSVGMVLLELGLQQPAIEMYNEASKGADYGDHSAAKFHKWILDYKVPQLGRLRGKEYVDATTFCLSADFASVTPEGIQRVFYLNVVRALNVFGYK
jgi:serine/threonine protein kinase